MGGWLLLGYPTGGFLQQSTFLPGLWNAACLRTAWKHLNPFSRLPPCQKQACQRGFPQGAPGAEPQPHRAGGCPHHEPPRQPHVRLHPQPEHGAAPRTDQKQRGCSQDSRHLRQPEQRGAAAGTAQAQGRLRLTKCSGCHCCGVLTVTSPRECRSCVWE